MRREIAEMSRLAPLALGFCLLATPVLSHERLATAPIVAYGPGVHPSVEIAQDAPRRRPGVAPRRAKPAPKPRPGAVPPPPLKQPPEFIPIPDRWRLIEAVGVNEKWWDPYNQNTLKGDRPLFDDWFINLAVISDTVLEPRALPTPVGIQTTDRTNSIDIFGDVNQFGFNENLIFSLAVIKGDTAFKPPDLEFRFTPVFNYNYAQVEERRILFADPSRGTSRTDVHIGIQEAFIDYHLRNVSDRFDFESVRVGIQPFSSDFRGFLFQDNQLGVRLFGNRKNNLFQYNLAWFRRIEKDTNSGLNDLGADLREDDIFIANAYFQDIPVRGFIAQATVIHNRNRESGEVFFNKNTFIERPASFGEERPRDYDVTYFGLNGDGHFGRLNLTASYYFAFGEDRNNQFSGVESDIFAYFAAVEPSIDFDAFRIRGSFLFASGDDDAFDDQENGFDAIFENPQFAGADTSFWIRQAVPLIGGGGVALSARNAVLPSLRSSKEHGQSNFNNPGLLLLGAGADWDVLPELRLSFNANYLRFATTESLEFLRNQPDIDEEIGYDLSASAIWRPFMSQNIVFRLSGAVLIPGDGFKDLFETDDDVFFSVLGNLVLAY
jgi:hypothetical protein